MFCAAALSACVALPDLSYQPEFASFVVPAINAKTTVEIGEAMILSGFRKSHDSLEVSEIVEVQGKSGSLPVSYTISPGEYLKIGVLPEGDAYSIADRTDSTIVNKPILAEGVRAIIDRSESGQICLITLFKQQVFCSETTGVKRSAYSVSKPDTLQKTLIYLGKSGNRITVGYREFNDNMARTAFSNEATYDLGESKVIGYLGARIEVINANNTSITYKVLSEFK